MPIEIRELIIKTTIADSFEKEEDVSRLDDFYEIKERIIEECIERTLEIIERRSER